MFIDTNTKTIFSTHSEIRNFFSGVSLPNNISDSDLASLGVKTITINIPLYNHITQTIEAQDVQNVDGEYFIDYYINDKTAEEIEAERKAEVPTQITPRQCRLQLLSLGLLDEVKTMCNANREMQIWFEYSLDFQRNHPMIEAMAVQLGLTQDNIDTMFIEASKL